MKKREGEFDQHTTGNETRLRIVYFVSIITRRSEIVWPLDFSEGEPKSREALFLLAES